MTDTLRTHLRCPNQPDAGPVCRDFEPPPTPPELLPPGITPEDVAYEPHPDSTLEHDPTFIAAMCQECLRVAMTPPCPICGDIVHDTGIHHVQWL